MVWVFIVFVALAGVSAHVLRLKLSSGRVGVLAFCAGFTYNIFFITYYMRVLDRSYYLFIGYYPGFIEQHPIVGWFCLIGILTHCLALPVRRWLAK